MANIRVSIPGYKVSEQLYNGSRTLVYRGYREIDSLPVVIKLLKNPYPSFSELLSFRNQYTIAKNLNSPLIVQTYGLEPYQNGYMLVMEHFGGISLKDYFTKVETLHTAYVEEFLRIAIALCNASALGLKYDLENCLTQLQVTGSIKDFEIAQRDVCDLFIIPDKLYGREAEIEIIL